MILLVVAGIIMLLPVVAAGPSMLVLIVLAFDVGVQSFW